MAWQPSLPKKNTIFKLEFTTHIQFRLISTELLVEMIWITEDSNFQIVVPHPNLDPYGHLVTFGGQYIMKTSQKQIARTFDDWHLSSTNLILFK